MEEHSWPVLRGVCVVVVALCCLIAGPGCRHQPGGQQATPSARQENGAEAVQTQRERAQEWFQRGLAAEDLAEKKRCYIEALREWPSYPEAHNNLGDVYEKQQDYDRALQEYKIAAALAPTMSAPFFGMGDVWLVLGWWKPATEAYKKGLALDPNDQLARRRLQIVETFSQTVLFDFDSSELTSRARHQLKQIAQVLREPELADVGFEVEGHADSTGPADYNLWLSKERAERVGRHLVRECGIPAERVTTRAYGEKRPLASNDTPAGRALNRRAQLIPLDVDERVSVSSSVR